MSVCAIDIGGTWTKLGLVSAAGEVRALNRIPTRAPAARFFPDLVSAAGEVLAEEGATAIGVSVAGFVDAAHSMMVYNPNLPWLERFPLQARLAESFGVPVQLEIDSNAAAIGEYRFGLPPGSPPGTRLLCLTVGTGIGGGFIADGRIARLTHDCVGDVGHVVVAPGGRLCSCGGRGCAEAVAAGPRIIEERLFEEAGTYIGLLAASLAAIFFPDRIRLGGGICEASSLVVESAQLEFSHSAGDAVRRATAIEAAKLGAYAPLIGAACPFLKTAPR